MTRVGPRLRSDLAGWSTFGLLLVAWEVFFRLQPSLYFPPVSTILHTFVEVWFSPLLAQHVAPSLVRMAAGYLIAAGFGIVLGIIMGSWFRVGQALAPLLEFFRAIPPPAIIPFALLTMGIGDATKVFVIGFSSLWPILLNSIDGARGVDEVMVQNARIFGVPYREIVVRVIAPAALPQVFAGLRASLAVAFITMVISEMVASTNGLGYFVLHAQRTFAVPEMYSGILLLGLLGYLVNQMFLWMEGRVLAWHRGWRAKQP